MKRHPTILQRRHTALLVIDIQTRVHAAMLYARQVEQNAVKLIHGFQILKAPIFVTEQYPQGLGATIPAIAAALGEISSLQKMSFSCCGSEELIRRLEKDGIKQVVLCGIETHVCVQQTALDLLAGGYQVHLVEEAASSRKESDHVTALARMRAAGVVPTSTEAVLFELMERADIAEFKQVSALIK